jgi:hypothetical protein
MLIRHFKGATFRLPATYVDAAGVAAPLTGQTVTAAIYPANAAPIPVTATVDSVEGGTYHLSASAAQTALWPRGTHPLHVTYTRTVAGETEVEIDAAVLIEVKEIV